MTRSPSGQNSLQLLSAQKFGSQSRQHRFPEAGQSNIAQVIYEYTMMYILLNLFKVSTQVLTLHDLVVCTIDGRVAIVARKATWAKDIAPQHQGFPLNRRFTH